MRHLLGFISVLWLSTWSAAGQQIDSVRLKESALTEVARRTAVVQDISRELWKYAELGLEERQSSDYLVSVLREAGFTVEQGVGGMPTAFVASFGSGKPVIGILAEFDALPGVGNASMPRKAPREDGVKSGHGCGHNLFAAASVVGALSLRATALEHHLRGTIRLFGTPAEETLVGKVYMAKDGIFDGLDAVIDWHPGTETEVRNQPGRAMNNFEIEFFGQAAHASSDPWNGRSALDAVEMLDFGVNLMREHIKPTARIHYVIPAAGEAPNVVPEYARVWYYARDINREEVARHYERILRIAEGAALATDTTYKVHLITGVHEYLINRPLQEAMQRNLELVGPVAFASEEQGFAKELQRFLKVEEKGFDAEIKPLAEGVGPVEGGSTDAAEVSYLAPTASFSVTTAAAGIPWHSWATTACHGTTGGERGALAAAKVVAATGVDLLTQPSLVEAAREAFLKASGGVAYESPVPLDQKPPLPSGAEGADR